MPDPSRKSPRGLPILDGRASLRQTADGGSGRALGCSPPVGRAACWAYGARLAGRGGGLRDGCVVRAAADPAARSGVLDQPVLCIQIELLHQVVAMTVHRARAEDQTFGDFLVGVSVADQSQDLFLTCRERAVLWILGGRGAAEVV